MPQDIEKVILREARKFLIPKVKAASPYLTGRLRDSLDIGIRKRVGNGRYAIIIESEDEEASFYGSLLNVSYKHGKRGWFTDVVNDNMSELMRRIQRKLPDYKLRTLQVHVFNSDKLDTTRAVGKRGSTSRRRSKGRGSITEQYTTNEKLRRDIRKRNDQVMLILK